MAKTMPAVVDEEVKDLVSADELAEFLADAGAGISKSADDKIVPFVALLQDMNPEVKKRDPNYVQGAEAGMWLNKATQQLYAGDAAMAERTGFPLLEFQHCELDKCVVEWVPRNDGGGFVARHSLQGTVEDTQRRLGKQMADPNDPKKKVWKTPEGNDLIETRYHYGNILTGGYPQPAVIAFSSTGHTTSKQWMSIMDGFKLPDGKGGLFTPPAWVKKYVIGSKTKENKKGSFFVGTVTDGGRIKNEAIRAAGKALFEGVNAGLVKAAVEETGSNSVSDEI
jgi:hypothetical protein